MTMDPLTAHACEVYLTGGIILGATPLDEWRPRDKRLRMIVDAYAADAADHDGDVSIVRVADRLHALDREHAWGSHITYCVDRHEYVRGRVASLMPVAVAIERARHACSILDRRSRRADGAVLALVDARDACDEAMAEMHRAVGALG